MAYYNGTRLIRATISKIPRIPINSIRAPRQTRIKIDGESAIVALGKFKVSAGPFENTFTAWHESRKSVCCK